METSSTTVYGTLSSELMTPQTIGVDKEEMKKERNVRVYTVVRKFSIL